MKIKDHWKPYLYAFFAGILAGILCRLSDFFTYDNFWSFPSIATMFGFWIASVGILTYISSSHRNAFFNTFLYMFGMTCSFYTLKSILGLFLEQFSGSPVFQTNLFLIYSLLAVGCGIGSMILYCWNRKNHIGVVLATMPASGMFAEAIGCFWMLVKHHTLFIQTVFDIVFGFIFIWLLYPNARYKKLYFITLAVITIFVFLVIYRPFLG